MTKIGPGQHKVVCTLVQIKGKSDCAPSVAVVLREKEPDATARVTRHDVMDTFIAHTIVDDKLARRPLGFVVHAVDNKGRPAVKFVDAEVALAGPDGPVDVTVGENEGGFFLCSYPPIQRAGLHTLDIKINGEHILDSPSTFMVSKVLEESQQVAPDADVWLNVYQLGRQDGLLSWQWELRNDTEDTWVVASDFSGVQNLGGRELSNTLETEVYPGETKAVSTLVQIDPAIPCSPTGYVVKAYEKAHNDALKLQEEQMPSALTDLGSAVGDIPSTGVEFVLFVKHWDQDEMKVHASPWARQQMLEEEQVQEADSIKARFKEKARSWLTPRWRTKGQKSKAPSDYIPNSVGLEHAGFLSRIAELEAELALLKSNSVNANTRTEANEQSQAETMDVTPNR